MTSSPWTQWLSVPRYTPLAEVFRDMGARHGRWTTWVVPLIYLGCLAAFVADLSSTDTLAFGVFYAPLIVTAVFHTDKRAIWVLTVIACTASVVGAFFPHMAVNVVAVVENRTLSICALLATAAFVRHARFIQDQLAEQTSRAEAAERIKTEVLANLSQEIRAPLYSMIGVLELVAADGRPDQKSALGMVRGAGRRLVSTVDNLVDLTQLDERSLAGETFDLGLLLRRTVEARRSDATARQIELSVDISATNGILAHANPWAVRRILENKVADAITYTLPGGRISVSTATHGDHVTAVIVTNGAWPIGAFQSTSDPDVSPMAPSLMGVALSQRLARAIGARLFFSNGPGEGTTVHIRLPAAPVEDIETP